MHLRFNLSATGKRMLTIARLAYADPVLRPGLQRPVYYVTRPDAPLRRIGDGGPGDPARARILGPALAPLWHLPPVANPAREALGSREPQGAARADFATPAEVARRLPGISLSSPNRTPANDPAAPPLRPPAAWRAQPPGEDWQARIRALGGELAPTAPAPLAPEAFEVSLLRGLGLQQGDPAPGEARVPAPAAPSGEVGNPAEGSRHPAPSAGDPGLVPLVAAAVRDLPSVIDSRWMGPGRRMGEPQQGGEPQGDAAPHRDPDNPAAGNHGAGATLCGLKIIHF